MEISLNRTEYNDLYPMIFGDQECESSHSFGPYIRDHYLIHYVVKGKGKLYKENRVYDVNPGQIFIIFPGEITTYTADAEDPWHYIWIGFNGSIAKRLRSLRSPVVYVDSSIFVGLLENLKNERGDPELILIAGLHLLFSELFAYSGKPDYVSRAESYVNALYMMDISVREIAESLNLDERYLSRIFKQKHGVPLGKYILITRMERAKLLLKDGIPVTSAAAMVGYPDYTGFSKLFKKYAGVSPKDYKKTETSRL